MRTTLRDVLSQRRPCETFNMSFGKQNTTFTVTVGYYEDGRIGEVFIDGAKAGSEMADITRDGAVLMSLALQHGVPLGVMQHAVSRNADHTAATIVGAVIDRIIAHEDRRKG
jgi:hypothetical protein